jgi:hypothetical protein
MGLAEVQALRISKLAGMVYALEEQLLDPEKIRTLEPKMLFGLYQVSVRALNDSSEFVERTLKSIDWNSLEAELLHARAQQVSDNKASLGSEESAELLSFIAQMKAEREGKNDK